ncbi:electron transfer flavoprotein subunit alpha/FixB family protein [Salinisphaera sp. Q1T1-3]|uniref:electron transfer flavoprotein subunit alpha/FixB family protein n=1 Tax=Salinisphaera sp. Q1T1-3 TaxID=2321229 RepID=UPI000E73A9EE|nr:FAD-binding protein [Salinisphaera sp. Q1T1-3]RJS95255.1 electron transfer flavoprotein subunit alpha/FixB family protein [Salinisphaera sp. Q1T1-3]
MSRILVIADHFEGTLTAATAKAVAGAREIAHEALDVLVLAADGAAIAGEAARLAGVDRVTHLDRAENAHPIAAIAAPQIVAAVTQGHYSHVLAPNTSFGKDMMPRVAALLGVEMVTDLSAVLDTHRFQRPIYAGNALTTVETPPDETLVATVRTASFKPVAADAQADVAARQLDDDIELPTHSRFVGIENHATDRPDLATAKRVVSGGRGVGSAANFDIIREFADSIGAAVGASRAAVDAGYVPNDMQVGQTGKIIAPELYICFGISGAIQHLAGIKDAGTIVAVNADPDAPIFEIADIGLVGDLFEIIPALQSALGASS